jgi:hypothetical protein
LVDKLWRVGAILCVGTGILLGAVSLAGVLYFGPSALNAAPVANETAGSPYFLSGLIHGLGWILSSLNGIADGIIKAFAAVSCLGLLFSAVMIQTGRGLRGRKRWAKFAALFILPPIALAIVAAASVAGLV